MTERNDKLIALIRDNRGDITDITSADNEFYFLFRGRPFSVLKHRHGGFSLFAYPKWRADLQTLVEVMNRGGDTPETVFVNITGTDSTVTRQEASDLFEWLRNQMLGLDELFQDLGIE